MTVKRERCPAPEMSFKRSNFVVTVALFNKGPFTIADIADINPTWASHRDKVKKVLQRLESHKYLTRKGDKYSLTEYGKAQYFAHSQWRQRYMKRPVSD